MAIAIHATGFKLHLPQSMLTVPLQQQEQGTLNVQCAKRNRSCPQMDDCSTEKFI